MDDPEQLIDHDAAKALIEKVRVAGVTSPEEAPASRLLNKRSLLAVGRTSRKC